MSLLGRVLSLLVSVLVAPLGGCIVPTSPPEELDQLGAVDVTIRGQPYRLWVADDDAEQKHGLMNVDETRLRPLPNGRARGMVFVYSKEQPLSFWMKNTVVPLDIAYIDANGVVVGTYTMAPRDEDPGKYRSQKPAMYAIEVPAGQWKRLGLRAGDRVDLWE